MINLAFTPRWLAGIACLVVATACSSDDCKRGATECVSDELIRTCIASPDGNQWLVAQCSPNATCLTDPTLVIRPAQGDDAGVGTADPNQMSLPKQPACVGNCDNGQHECVSDALARYCVGSGVWMLDACDVGEKCVNGVCAVGQGSGSVQACKPGTKACASDRVAKVCDADGTSWVETPCAASETCSKDSCAPNTSGACDTGDSCLDSKTAVRCIGPGQGYEVDSCSGDTYCENGHCRGTACVVGSSCIGSNQVRECVDGASFKDTQCAVNEVCAGDDPNGKCVPLQCNVGTTACGDPRDPSVDAKKNFSVCVMGEGGVPLWVRGECQGAGTCDPSKAGNTGNTALCSDTCTKGAESCAQDPLTGVNDGIETCGDDGKWSLAKSCNPGADARLVCVVPPNPDASQLPKALCAAPICAWALQNPSVGATGACDDDKLRACKPDGTLADAVSCEHGVCRTLRSDITNDGLSPGACDTSPECQDGEDLCSTASGTVTPRYRSCVNGFWGAELKTCDNDALCYTREDDKGLRHALCGAECSPGSRRCNGSGQVQTCDDNGHYGGGETCSAGRCTALKNNDAACVLQCMPGSHICTGSTALAADGYHSGTTQQITCNDDGTRGSAQNCPSGTMCRTTGASVVLGCVQCVGPNAVGGNDDGTADSRCDPNDDKKLQECGDDNTWAASRMCSGTRTCVPPQTESCGTCMGGSGATFVCTESRLAADQSGQTCDSKNYGSPGAWGGEPDCCKNYQQGLGTAASFAYCK